MKKPVFHLLFLSVFTLTGLCQTPEEITADFKVKANRACEKLDATLQRESTAIAAKIVTQGDSEGPATISEQVRLKLEGAPVLSPHAAVATLFLQYDTARKAALKPHREEAIRRLDSLLEGSAGKDMANVMKVGKARGEIESGIVPPPDTLLTPRTYLSKFKIPKVWGYYLSPAYDVKYGTLTLKEDGTFHLHANTPVEGTWIPTSDPKVMEFSLMNKDGSQEKTTLNIIDDNSATMKRVTGQRFLKSL